HRLPCRPFQPLGSPPLDPAHPRRPTNGGLVFIVMSGHCSSYLVEVGAQEVVLLLLLQQTWPKFGLSLLLSESQLDGTGGNVLPGLGRVDLLEKLELNGILLSLDGGSGEVEFGWLN